MKKYKKQIAAVIAAVIIVIAGLVFGAVKMHKAELPENSQISETENIDLPPEEEKQTEEELLENTSSPKIEETAKVSEEAKKNENAEQNAVTFEKQEPTQKPSAEPKEGERKDSNEQNSEEVKKTEETLKPTEPQKTEEPPKAEAPALEENSEHYCTLSVNCNTILSNLDKLDEGKKAIVPENGIIFPETKVVFHEGESVFNVLKREMKKNKIHMEFENTPVYNTAYVEGIGNLYEFDCGELSGWKYRVNGTFPSFGASKYILKDGDKIEWLYTCDLGADIGGDFSLGGQRDE